MNIRELFENKKKLESQIIYYKKRKLIQIIDPNKTLVNAHIQKADHNLKFFTSNQKKEEFADWLIVILYYTLYHAALALLANKNLISKNHSATICLLIREYGISQSEAELINELSINKEDAELYTNLKSDRHSASYATNIVFDIETAMEYRTPVLDFVTKTKDLLGKTKN